MVDSLYRELAKHAVMVSKVRGLHPGALFKFDPSVPMDVVDFSSLELRHFEHYMGTTVPFRECVPCVLHMKCLKKRWLGDAAERKTPTHLA